MAVMAWMEVHKGATLPVKVRVYERRRSLTHKIISIGGGLELPEAPNERSEKWVWATRSIWG